MTVQQFRHRQLLELTSETGVYALCDLDRVPIYVGQSIDGIRARVRRHLTSARSDVIANRQIDVWEVAYVWAWPIDGKARIDALESTLFHEFDPVSSLMNGSVPEPAAIEVGIPERQELRVLPADEIERRREPRYRFPRQAQQVASLLDYIIETMDKRHLRRSLHAHFERLQKYYSSFQEPFLPDF